jgi:hypothetical protein
MSTCHLIHKITERGVERAVLHTGSPGLLWAPSFGSLELKNQGNHGPCPVMEFVGPFMDD